MKDCVKNILIVLLWVAVTLAIAVTISNILLESTPPVERNTVIDSITTVNDSLKLKVEHLDSIKNAKVIEVSTLDNDSTLKLFYKLVHE